jgi:hypothetical protein
MSIGGQESPYIIDLAMEVSDVIGEQRIEVLSNGE